MTRYLYICLALITFSALATFKVTSNYYQAQHKAALSAIETKQAKDAAAIAKSNEDKFRAAQSLSDVLSASLANTEQQINQLTLEKTREIHHYTTGNTCFNAGLTGLLNSISSELATESQASSASVTESATTTATEGESLTDQDVAEWIANAQGQYETCRGRLGALIDFELTAQ